MIAIIINIINYYYECCIIRMILIIIQKFDNTSLDVNNNGATFLVLSDFVFN